MATQIVHIPPNSEEALGVPKSVNGQTIRFDADRLAGTTKPLADNPLLRKQIPVTFHLIAAGIALNVQLADKIFIGRQDDDFEANDNLDIDLMAYGARELGVSRRHAMLCRISYRPSIMDLKSTNGTFINGLRLEPDKPQILRDGDEICFGKMLCHIHFGP